MQLADLGGSTAATIRETGNGTRLSASRRGLLGMLAAAPLLTAAAMPAPDAAWSALIRRYEDTKRRELLASSELARAEAGCKRALAALKEPADYGVFRRGDTVDAYNDRTAAAKIEQVQREAAVRASFAIDALEDAQTEAGETLYDIVTEIIHFPVHAERSRAQARVAANRAGHADDRRDRHRGDRVGRAAAGGGGAGMSVGLASGSSSRLFNFGVRLVSGLTMSSQTKQMLLRVKGVGA